MLPFSQCNRSSAKKDDEREGLRFEETEENTNLLFKKVRVNGLGKYNIFARQHYARQQILINLKLMSI